MASRFVDIFDTLRAPLCVALATLFLWSANTDAQAGSPGGEIAFSLPAGDLAEALTTFSTQSGISVIFDNRLVGGRKSPVLLGAYAADKAIAILLADTGLFFQEVDNRTWAIIVSPAARSTDVERLPSIEDDENLRRNLRDEIIVTASYRTPSHFAGTRALYTLDGEQMRLNGALNIAEPIFELPATVTSVSSANTALLLSSGGLNLADLRGLGPERTLVLVNGRRYIRTSGGNGTTLGVDLNSIPAPFVDRIEVVNQGAGAAIGMEAVAGAVNIVTREDIDGIAVTADGGISASGDAEEYSVSLLGGKRFGGDRGRIALGVTFASEASLLAQERSNTSSPYGFSENGVQSGFSVDAVFAPGFGGSGVTPYSRLSGVLTQAGDVVFLGSSDRQVVAPDGLSFEPFEGRLDQLYNWTTDFSALPEIERLIGYGAGSYELSSSHTAYAEFHFANTEVATQIGSSPVSLTRGRSLSYGDGIFVPAGDPATPAGLLTTAEGLAGAPVSGFLLDRRFVELGPRRRQIDRQTFQIAGGLEGSLGGKWRYDFSFQYGANRTSDIATGLVDDARLSTAIDAGACALVAQCSPINIFSSASITPEQVAFILADPRERVIKTREQIAQVRFSGPVYNNKDKQGYITVGLEHRRERFEDMFLPSNSSTVLGSFIIPGSFGKIALTEAYVNGSFPLIVDAPWTRFLEIGGAYRITNRQGVGEFSSLSGNARWSPVDGLEFYAHLFRGGRAPNVMEQFSAGPNLNQLFFDPCDENSGSSDSIVFANCMTSSPLSVGPGFVQDNALALSESSGNPTLREERVSSHLFGLSADIHALIPSTPGILTLSADWRRHLVTDAAVSVGAQSTINQCFHSENLSSFLCGLNPVTGNRFIQRDLLTRQILEVESTLINGGRLLTSGLDARLQYLAEFDSIPMVDMFALDILYTYIHRVRSQGLLDDAETVSEGLVAFPRHQLHATASLGTEAVKTVWTVRRRGKAASYLGIDHSAFHAPAVIYVDMALQWRIGDHGLIYAGVENIFDRDIPVVANAPNGYFFEHYDPIGRRFFCWRQGRILASSLKGRSIAPPFAINRTSAYAAHHWATHNRRAEEYASCSSLCSIGDLLFGRERDCFRRYYTFSRP